MTPVSPYRVWARGCLFFFTGAALTAFSQPSFERIHSFGFAPQTGDNPKAGVIEGSDGWLYGTTVNGGLPNQGTVFRVCKDGTGHVVLHHFGGTAGDGLYPVAELFEGTDGALYGTTWEGGGSAGGTVFKLNKDGSEYKVLLSLEPATQGSNPAVGVSEGGDGRLYVAARKNGPSLGGTVFCLNKDGSGFELLHAFGGDIDGGSEPNSPVLHGTDGSLYGVAYSGGTFNGGTFFKINRDGSAFTVLRGFASATDGRGAYGNLCEGTDHRLYGVLVAGGNFGGGTLYAVERDGAGFTVLHHFGQSGDGSELNDGVIQGKEGALYGVTFTGGPYMNGIVFKIQTDGTGYTNLHQFNGGDWDGYRPQGPLCLASDGALYGTTTDGGANNIGSLFRISPDGSGYAVLRDFNVNGGDAMTVTARLLEASNGVLYGMGSEGGARVGGAIFRVTKDGTGYGILHDFDWQTDDGSVPYGGFIEGTNGALYGTTGYGGGFEAGTVFRINKDGTGYEILHRFTGTNSTGAYPSAELRLGGDGKLYGRTISGGAGNGATLFRINHDGSGFESIYSFAQNGGPLYSPDANLIEGTDGALYGTSYGDGPNWDGTVWRINKDGTGFQVLHSFSEQNADGYYPDGGLLQAPDGTLYGTTTYGGTFDSGTLFKVSPDGTGYGVVYHFNQTNSEGHWPRGDLLKAGNGILLGVTYVGGQYDGGTVYTLNVSSLTCTTLHAFADRDGWDPFAGLILGNDSRLYGTTTFGGDLGLGSLFRLPFFAMQVQPFAQPFRLSIKGIPGQAYAIEASDVLPSGWSELGMVTNVSGEVEWSDSRARGTNRLYRARWLP